ncbi:MAG TPA: MopE-related protein, partial [Polyangiaceae bacterium]|nr:MopE-related protein [Polyangiaceae bacterium]
MRTRFRLFGLLAVSIAPLILVQACGSDSENFKPASAGGAGGGGAGGKAGSAGGLSTAGASGEAGQGGAPEGGQAGTPAVAGASGEGGAGGAAPVCTDADNDGVTDCDGDCDDGDKTSFPGNPEICGDGADNDCANGVDDVCGGIGTYVSNLTGDDTTGLGTKDSPVQTIGKGIANALLIQATTQAPIDVYVSEGDYAEKVTMVETVNLLGGYSCPLQPCDWSRDPSLNVSNIVNTDFEGVLADKTITPATTIDGFTITGLD